MSTVRVGPSRAPPRPTLPCCGGRPPLRPAQPLPRLATLSPIRLQATAILIGPPPSSSCAIHIETSRLSATVITYLLSLLSALSRPPNHSNKRGSYRIHILFHAISVASNLSSGIHFHYIRSPPPNTADYAWQHLSLVISRTSGILLLTFTGQTL